jgi:hypothetical protein
VAYWRLRGGVVDVVDAVDAAVGVIRWRH